MAAAVQVVLTKVLYELQVVESICQTHILLQTDVWRGREPSGVRVNFMLIVVVFFYSAERYCIESLSN